MRAVKVELNLRQNVKGAWLPQSVEDATPDLVVMSLTLTPGAEMTHTHTYMI